MTVLRNLLLAGLVLAIGAMLWQHFRYADVRRSVVQDRQSAFHGNALHVLTYLEVVQEEDPVPKVRALAAAAAQGGHGELVYAGQAIVNGLISEQLKDALGREVAWDAIVLQQFADRAAYERYRADPAVADALDSFPTHFSHGFRRSSALSAMLPQLLLAKKLWRAATFQTASLPLEPAAEVPFGSLVDNAMVERAGERGRDAIFIVNLIRNGDAESRAANADYGNRMLNLMADFGYGPLHLGAAEPIDHPLEYDSIALVYYPGAAYFRDLVASRYFQDIIGDKQLADTQATITVPITDLVAPAG